MSEPSHGGGERVSYTTKELLAEIRDGISAIKTTTSNHEERIVKLEAIALEHEEIRKLYVPKIDTLVRDLDIQSEVRAALDAREDRGFTRKQKLVGLAFALVTTVLNVMTLGPDLI